MSAYRRAIGNLVASQSNNRFYGMAIMILGGILIEPWSALKTLLNMGLTWRKTLHSGAPLNPLELTAEQGAQNPILLIHGNYLDETCWLSLAKRLEECHMGPVFTVKLPSGRITAIDMQLVNDRIAHIQGVYRINKFNPLPVHLIGHSRGGDLIERIALNTKMEIGKMIKIGSVMTPCSFAWIKQNAAQLKSRIFEILGTHDLFAPKNSLLPLSQQHSVPTGHIGLLYSSKAHNRIIESLQSRSV